MNGQFEAAWQLHRFLTERDIAYVVIGGIAVQRWGEPRLTIDVDLAILLPAGGEERRLREIAAAFPPRLKDAVAFALELQNDRRPAAFGDHNHRPPAGAGEGTRAAGGFPPVVDTLFERFLVSESRIHYGNLF